MNRDKLKDLVEKYKIEDVKLKDIDFEEERDTFDNLKFIDGEGKVRRFRVGEKHEFNKKRKVLNSGGEDYFA